MSEPYHNKALAPGSILREWRLERILGVGGFGIVYAGRGVYFDEPVAIKEYFPTSVSDRVDGTTVAPNDSSAEEVYAIGLMKFVEEAKVLWNLSKPERHPNIVSVRSLFEVNGTAYMVMDFEQGVSLSQMLKQGRKFDEASLLALIRPIAEGLDRAHRAGVIHRDIKPANILVNDNDRPVLIDFGSARFEAGQATTTKVTFYTPPYAAIEQYVKTYPQGPWTDIYALGVTLYECATGQKPPDVLERLHAGQGQTLAGREPTGFSPRFIRAVDAAMAIQPAERPQSIPQWLALFDADPAPAADLPTQIAAPLRNLDAIVPPAAPAKAAEPPAPPAAEPPAAEAAAEPTAPAGAGKAAPGRGLQIAAAAGAVVVLGLGGLVLARLTRHPAPAVAPASATAPAAAPAAGAALAPGLQALPQALQGLASDAQAARRPAQEVSALTQAAQSVSAMVSGPGAAAKAGPIADAARSAATAEADALGRESRAQLRAVQHNPAWRDASAPSVKALIQARTDLDAAVAATAQAGDAGQAVDSARRALADYQTFAHALAGASGAFLAAERAAFAAPDAAARSAAAQVLRLAAGPKPWLFASRQQKEGYQAAQANAARARALVGELDSLSASVRAASSLAAASADVERAEGLRRQLEALQSSTAAAMGKGR